MDITLALQSFGIVFLIILLCVTAPLWAPFFLVGVLIVFAYATLSVINEDMNKASEMYRRAREVQSGTRQVPQERPSRPAIFEQGLPIIPAVKAK